MPERSEPEDTTLLRALLALAIAEREERARETEGSPKTEVLLSAAGLDSSEIAVLVGKTPGAVRMTLSRARASEPKE